ncbi:hypothetical protein PVL29_012464 [Vitis rotundifolia]|uniref:ATPase AAA-type core domain-containing protein n=1 Tax=Vitis rotundifolia TaxID=103349 RepID=A0AA38ZJK8_VITRO|nr:hypothetical protein PVL29_012464 [Vitis rotundifolia]
MASVRRLLKAAQSWRPIVSPKTLTPPPLRFPPRLCHRPFEQQINPRISEAQLPPVSVSIVPSVLVGLFGFGLLEIAHAESDPVTMKFQIPPTCEVPCLIAKLVAQLGMKVEERSGGSDMIMRAWDSGIAWQLMLSRLGKQNKTGAEQEIEFIKQGSFSPEELDALVSVLQFAGGRVEQNKTLERRPRGDAPQMHSAQKSIASLEAMGVRVFGADEPLGGHSKNEVLWDNIAGYDQQKRQIEDEIVFALHSPDVYDDVARGTRQKFESNRPRAVLFEGPPGIQWPDAMISLWGVPLVYLPLESIMSKYYGESERLLGKVFVHANEFPEGAIVFLDEVDSFAVSRGREMHEATRRILSVILRQIDGFEQDKKVVVIAATNRKQDLDPALISRFDSMITFGLPENQDRQKIAAQFAKHLTESELVEFATATEGMSGRDIRDICQQAERHWASKVIRGQAPKDGEQVILPPIQLYIESAKTRANTLLSIADQETEKSNRNQKQPQLAFS